MRIQKIPFRSEAMDTKDDFVDNDIAINIVKAAKRTAR